MSSHWSRPRLAAGIAALLAAAGAVALAISVNPSAKASTATTPPSPVVMNHYSVFDRAAVASDALPVVSLTEAQPLAEGTLTRLVSQDAGSDSEWATLTGERLCVILRSTPSVSSDGHPDMNRSCVAATELEVQSQLLLQLSLVGSNSSTPPVSGLANVISGLAPDGVTAITLDFADGTQQTVAVKENGFMDNLTSPKILQHLTWTSPTGTTIIGQ